MKIIRYKCECCGKEFLTSIEHDFHFSKCIYNPKSRSCTTCGREKHPFYCASFTSFCVYWRKEKEYRFNMDRLNEISPDFPTRKINGVLFRVYVMSGVKETKNFKNLFDIDEYYIFGNPKQKKKIFELLIENKIIEEK
jgi:hypothetical protein